MRLLAATFAAAIEASSVGDTQQKQESFRQDLEIHKILWPGLFQGGSFCRKYRPKMQLATTKLTISLWGWRVALQSVANDD